MFVFFFTRRLVNLFYSRLHFIQLLLLGIKCILINHQAFMLVLDIAVVKYVWKVMFMKKSKFQSGFNGVLGYLLYRSSYIGCFSISIYIFPVKAICVYGPTFEIDRRNRNSDTGVLIRAGSEDNYSLSHFFFFFFSRTPMD